MKSSVDSTEKNLERATNLLQELDDENKKGLPFGDKGSAGKLGDLEAEFNKKMDLMKQDSDENIGDNYDDDFDDDIEEDLPEDNDDPLANAADDNAASANVAVTVS